MSGFAVSRFFLNFTAKGNSIYETNLNRKDETCPKIIGGPVAAGPAAVLAKDDKPNIVFFLVDDMGWVDSSVAYGEEVYPNNLRFHTPNMDRLAREALS